MQILAGFGLTPLGVRRGAGRDRGQDADDRDGGGDVGDRQRSPYIVRSRFTLPQVTVPIAEWAAKNGIKKVVTLVSDYGPGNDAEKFFKSRSPRPAARSSARSESPLANPDFAPFIQKVEDLKPDAVFCSCHRGWAPRS